MNLERYWENQDNQFDDTQDQIGRSLLPLDWTYAGVADDRGAVFFIRGQVTSRRAEGFPDVLVIAPSLSIQHILQAEYVRVYGSQCMRVPTDYKSRTLIDMALRNENVAAGIFHYNEQRVKGIYLL